MRDLEFLTSVRSHLTTTGVVAFNLAGTDRWCRACTDSVRAVFGNSVVEVKVEADGNLVLLAFKDSAAASPLQTSKARSAEIKRRFGLEFPAFFRALQWRDPRREPA